MDRGKACFIWLMYTNQDARVMEGLRTKVAEIKTAIKPEIRGSYERGKSGAWKTWHGRPHAGTK